MNPKKALYMLGPMMGKNLVFKMSNIRETEIILQSRKERRKLKRKSK
ncbi:hypothetical protein ACTS9V_06745 [Empedobacter falsenii]